jgi:hypothetical protein
MQFSNEERNPFSRTQVALRLESVDLADESDFASFDWLIRNDLHDGPNDFDSGLIALCRNPSLWKCPTLLRRIVKHTRCDPALKKLAVREDLALFPDVVATLVERNNVRETLRENPVVGHFVNAAGGSLDFAKITQAGWEGLSDLMVVSPCHPSPSLPWKGRRPQTRLGATEHFKKMRGYFGLCAA